MKASPAAEEDEESEDEDEEESAGPRRPTANADLLEPVEDG